MTDYMDTEETDSSTSKEAGGPEGFWWTHGRCIRLKIGPIRTSFFPIAEEWPS